MSLYESGDSSGHVSFEGLFRGEFKPAQVHVGAARIVDLACRGGWPEAIDLEPIDAQLVAREYLRLLRVESTVRQDKDPEVARRLLFSLAKNLGQSATYKTITADMLDASSETGGIAENTLVSYLSLLKNMYVVEELMGWLPPMRSAKRVSSKPRRYFADPSFVVAALGMAPGALMQDWQAFGLVFENMCMRGLQVYASCNEYLADQPVRYYRDDAGLEADAIIELADGRWAAVEIKTSERKVPDAVESLKRLRSKLCDNATARVRPPEFMMVLTGVSEFARRVEEGIYVVPPCSLRP